MKAETSFVINSEGFLRKWRGSPVVSGGERSAANRAPTVVSGGERSAANRAPTVVSAGAIPAANRTSTDEPAPERLAASGPTPNRARLTGRCRPGLILGLLLLVLPAAFGNALSVSTIDARTGLLWLGNAGNGQVVAPSPLLNYWGASVPLNFNSRFSVVPELDLFGTQYQLFGTRGIPTEIEHASQVWMLSVLLDPEVRYTLPISKALAWGFSLSPAFIFRIPTISWSISAADIGTITKYLYAKGRFFYPSVGTFFDWQVFPKIALEVRIRSFFPVFHLWDGEGLPFYDQLMVDGSIGLRFRIGK